MQDEIISFETAKLAKEKGFEQNPYLIPNAYLPRYNDGSDIHLGSSLFSPENNVCTAPTLSILQKWIRDKHNIFIEIHTDQTTYPKFVYVINRFIGNPKDLTEKEWYWEKPKQSEYLYKSYEEALEEGLQIALNLIK